MESKYAFEIIRNEYSYLTIHILLIHAYRKLDKYKQKKQEPQRFVKGCQILVRVNKSFSLLVALFDYVYILHLNLKMSIYYQKIFVKQRIFMYYLQFSHPFFVIFSDKSVILVRK